ncbi:MAG: peptidase dimerization domain-containing protein [Bryobacterales bacterium]
MPPCYALADVAASGSAACEIWLAATIDEEHAFRGVAKLCEDFRADGAVVAEPTGLRAVVATKGVLRWPIRVLGRAAHSAKPHLGLNAIGEMARLVLDLEDENERLAANPHPLLGPATQHRPDPRRQAGQLRPRRMYDSIDRRLIPGESIR